jgi:Uma2 family endonuclease
MLADVPHFELAPDWICEILSPSTGVYDRRDKLRIYARERIPRVWLIDPRNRTLEVLRLEGTQWMLELASGGDDKVRAQPFDAIELDLSVLWLPAAAPSEAR